MSDSISPKPLRAIFLAAGFATRMYPLTRDRAKPLIEVGGEPMLTRLLGQVASTGLVRDAVVVTNGRFAADFERWRADVKADLAVTLVDDGALDDDGKLGAVRDLAFALERTSEPPAPEGYLVLAADNLFEFDLTPILQCYLDSSEAQLIVRRVPAPIPAGRYSEVQLDANDKIVSFREKPADPQSNLSAIGLYVLPPHLPELVSEYLTDGGNPDAPGHFIAWLAARQPLRATRLEGPWFDIGSLQDLDRARAELG